MAFVDCNRNATFEIEQKNWRMKKETGESRIHFFLTSQFDAQKNRIRKKNFEILLRT